MKARERWVEHQKQLGTRSAPYRKGSAREAVELHHRIVESGLGARKALSPSSSRWGRGGPSNFLMYGERRTCSALKELLYCRKTAVYTALCSMTYRDSLVPISTNSNMN